MLKFTADRRVSSSSSRADTRASWRDALQQLAAHLIEHLSAAGRLADGWERAA